MARIKKRHQPNRRLKYARRGKAKRKSTISKRKSKDIRRSDIRRSRHSSGRGTGYGRRRPVTARKKTRASFRQIRPRAAAEEAKKLSLPSPKEVFLVNVNRDVGPEFCFVLSDGKRVYSLKELAVMLDSMADEVFSFHVNDEKNDFRNWVRDIIKDEELCRKMEGAKNTKDMQLCILKHIVTNI